jgi:ABC-type nickel/cobalt efflux system permease component RcnA
MQSHIEHNAEKDVEAINQMLSEIAASKKAADEIEQRNTQEKRQFAQEYNMKIAGEVFRLDRAIKESKEEIQRQQKIIDEAKHNRDRKRQEKVRELQHTRHINDKNQKSNFNTGTIAFISGLSICSAVVALACLNFISIGLMVGLVLTTAIVCGAIGFFASKSQPNQPKHKAIEGVTSAQRIFES